MLSKIYTTFLSQIFFTISVVHNYFAISDNNLYLGISLIKDNATTRAKT
jgi:hypothetical protein